MSKKIDKQAIRFLLLPLLEYLQKYVAYFMEDSCKPDMYIDDNGNTIDISSDLSSTFYSYEGGIVEKKQDGSGCCYGIDGVDYGDISSDGNGFLLLSDGRVITISSNELDEKI